MTTLGGDGGGAGGGEAHGEVRAAPPMVRPLCR